MASDSNRPLTPAEVSMIAGCPTATVLAAIRSGDLHARQFNARVIITTRAGVDAWLRKCEARAKRSTQATSATSLKSY